MTLPRAPNAAIVAYLFSLYSIIIGNKLAFLCFVSLFCFSCFYYTPCYCFESFCLHRRATYTNQATLQFPFATSSQYFNERTQSRLVIILLLLFVSFMFSSTELQLPCN